MPPTSRIRAAVERALALPTAGSAPVEPAHMAGAARGLVTLDFAPATAQRIAVTVQDARKVAQDAMMDYVGQAHPDHALLVRMDAGTGKSHLAAGVAGWLSNQGQRVLWAAPRHDYIHDLRNLLSKQGYNPASVYEWQARQEGDEERGKPHTCLHTNNIGKWMGRGYLGMDFCSRICGWDYVGKGCAYHAQKKRAEPIIMGVHQHVTLGHPMDFNVVIGDESPLATFINPWHIPARFIMPAGMDAAEPLTEMMFLLQRLCNGENVIRGVELLQALGGAQNVIDTCATFTMPAGAAVQVPYIRTADDAENVPYFHLPALTRLLHREAETALSGKLYAPRISIEKDGLLMLLRHEVNEGLPERMIWLDATGDPALYEALFGRKVEVIEPFVQRKGKMIQVVGRANNKRSLAGKDEEDNDVIDAERYGQVLEQVRHIIKQGGLKRAGIITYKTIAERLAADLPGVRTMHFYAARGSNTFEDVDGLIVIGTPQPSPINIDYLARMVFFDSMETFNRQWTPMLLPYAYTDAEGKGKAYPINGYWHDTKMQTILWQQREAEVQQAVHRARIINRDVTVWLLCNLPLPNLPPDRILEIRDLLGAPAGTDVFLWAQAMRVADDAIARTGYVTTADFTAGMGIDARTGRKYVEHLAGREGWQLAAVPSGHGSPTKGAVPPAGELRN
jgi:hypothetical protein